jgi:hypothetical protein
VHAEFQSESEVVDIAALLCNTPCQGGIAVPLSVARLRRRFDGAGKRYARYPPFALQEKTTTTTLTVGRPVGTDVLFSYADLVSG